MKISSTFLEGVKIIEPQAFTDERGYFMESYRQDRLEEAGITDDFVQGNQSLSGKGILRGLHFQRKPFAQSKLVRVIKGSVLDVAVDIRKDSPTYGQHIAVKLTEQNFKQLYVPKGFAHGFLTLEDQTIFSYKCGAYYHKESEGGLMWNDPALEIDWGITKPTLSSKDNYYPAFEDFDSPF